MGEGRGILSGQNAKMNLTTSPSMGKSSFLNRGIYGELPGGGGQTNTCHILQTGKQPLIPNC